MMACYEFITFTSRPSSVDSEANKIPTLIEAEKPHYSNNCRFEQMSPDNYYAMFA
jgi:hypothetical protein